MAKLTNAQVKSAVTLLAEANTAKWVAKELGITQRDLLEVAQRYGYPDLDRLTRSAEVLNRAAGVPAKRAERLKTTTDPEPPLAAEGEPEPATMPQAVAAGIRNFREGMEAFDLPNALKKAAPAFTVNPVIEQPTARSLPMELNKITVTVGGKPRDYGTWSDSDFEVEADKQTGWLTVKTPQRQTMLARWDEVNIDLVTDAS